MSNKRFFFVMFVSASALVLLVFSTALIAKEHHDERLELAKAKQAANRELFSRQCAAKWPMRGDHFQACIERAEKMLRRDI